MNRSSFYLGTHEVGWLARHEIPDDCRLFVSHRRLSRRQHLPRAHVRWALDSGGFTELQLYGQWRTSPSEYVAAVRRYRDEIGSLDWATPQDWMCEPAVINGGVFGGVTFAGTGLSVADHQARTVQNFLTLSQLWNDEATNPFIPVLQGYERGDYLRCIDLYQQAGIELTKYQVVGLGSVCRRQAETEIGDIVTDIQGALPGLPLHGFGVKRRGLEKYGHLLASADSMAWSFDARRAKRLPECVRHTNCSNCINYALHWRRGVIDLIEGRTQVTDASIAGYCPMGCGETLSLVHIHNGGGGMVSCLNPGCPRPFAVSELLRDSETEHVVVVSEAGYTAKHPMRERLNDALLHCLPQAAMARQAEMLPPGRYRVRRDEADSLAWEHLEEG